MLNSQESVRLCQTPDTSLDIRTSLVLFTNWITWKQDIKHDAQYAFLRSLLISFT